MIASRSVFTLIQIKPYQSRSGTLRAIDLSEPVHGALLDAGQLFHSHLNSTDRGGYLDTELYAAQLQDNASFVAKLYTADTSSNGAADSDRSVAARDVARVEQIHRFSDQLIGRCSHRKSHAQT